MSAADEFGRLVGIMARLRAAGGCPWDREQSRESLRPYLIEEAYEVLEAIDGGDVADIADELGDLLLQVVFHAQIASEGAEFDIADVCSTIADKLVRRHPHVFGGLTVRDAGEVVHNWARIKAHERGARGLAADALAGVPQSLPALLQAERLGEKARRVGFDWADVRGVLDKAREELAELEQALSAGDRAVAGAELGDLLLTLASVGRHLGCSAELVLRAANTRFADRFREMERQATREGAPLGDRGPEDLDRLWRAAKRRLAAASPDTAPPAAASAGLPGSPGVPES
jgi:ATP diphosphatase